MKQYFLDRLKEASTWRGIILILSAAGVPLNPEHAEAVIAIGMAVAGSIGVFLPDQSKDRAISSTDSL